MAKPDEPRGLVPRPVQSSNPRTLSARHGHTQITTSPTTRPRAGAR